MVFHKVFWCRKKLDETRHGIVVKNDFTIYNLKVDLIGTQLTKAYHVFGESTEKCRLKFLKLTLSKRKYVFGHLNGGSLI